MRAQEWEIDPYTYKNLQMSFVEMGQKPHGMVAEREL
jgi:hypothetical protein